jgi:uncharacterized delta-60 repeat protein
MLRSRYAVRAPRVRLLILLVVLMLALACRADEVTQPELERNTPTRIWHFGRLADDWTETTGPIDSQVGGVVHEFEEYGVHPLSINGSRVALGEVFSSADGVTYWVSTNGAPENDGSNVVLEQLQSFRKNTPDAELILTVTALELLAADFNSSSPSFCPMFCDTPIMGRVELEVTVYGELDPVYIGRSGAELYRAVDSGWKYQVTEESQMTPMWRLDDLVAQGLDSTVSKVTLARHIPIDVDISQVDSGQEFTMRIVATATTYNVAHRETFVSAHLRDPAGGNGTTLSFTGLTPTNNPLPPPSFATFGQAPACGTPNPAAGTLQFAGSAFRTAEAPFTSDPVLVTRTGGSSGRVSVRVRSTGGSALAGSDYRALDATVAFGDGDVTPKVVRLPIIPNGEIQPDRTVELTLSDARGCATLGASAATITIQDDDTPIAPDSGFSIGGTVNGVAGTGLILRNSLTGENLPVGNGPFTFAQRLPDTFSYDVIVATQPTAPAQVCTVANGEGTVAGANVTNVVVTCVTPPPISGLDSTFSGDGKATTALNAAVMQAVVVQADGRILVAGRAAPTGDRDFALVRYNSDGSADGGFGTGGIVTTPFLAGRSDEANDVALQADGKIVVVGERGDDGADPDFAVARYNSDGTLDGSFGSAGLVATDFGGGSAGVSVAQGVVVQPDGRIVVAGHASLGAASASGNDFALARYLPNGNLDSTFGTAGLVLTQVRSKTDLAFAVALQADGRIILAGRTESASTGDDFALVRYLSNGSVDSSFGSFGIVTANLGTTSSTDIASALALQPDGRIVAGGMTGASTGSFNFGLIRFLADGSVDNSFGGSGTGRAITDFSGQDDFLEDLALAPDGKIVAIGRRTSATLFDMGIARYLPDGTLDGGFGSGGKLEIDFFGGSDAGTGVAVQPDGKIVGVGQVFNGTASNIGIVRVRP